MRRRTVAAALARLRPSSARSYLQGPTISTNQRAYTSPTNHDHNRIVGEPLLLSTVAGAADLLAEDLRASGATSIAMVDDATVCCLFHGTINTLRRIGTVASVGIILGQASAGAPDLGPILASMDHGVLSALDLETPIRFRLELSRTEERRAVVAGIRDRTGWSNSPADWHINIARRGVRWIAEVGYLHYSSRFGRLRRQPWSTNPALAAILVRLAKIKAGQTVHDPFCGTGTLLIAAHQVHASVRLSGTDHDHDSVAMARANLRDRQAPAIITEADAIPICHPPGTVDRVISNLPFGKQVGSHAYNAVLYPRLIHELGRTLAADGRAVLLTEDKRLLVEAVTNTPGVKIIRQRLLRYHGASPTAYVITRTRTSNRARPDALIRTR